VQRGSIEPSAEQLRRTGVVCSVAAYTLWGAFPLYFKALAAAPLEVLGHRVIWSALFLAVILSLQRRWVWLLSVLRSRRVLLGAFASASLLSVNWFVYIWAVGEGRVVDASLGYFITPLVSVLIGVLLLGEALRPGQWLAMGTAALGVLWLTLQFAELPWVGLVLAGSFGSYGALRKTARLGPLEGLMLETLLMLPFALLWQGVLLLQHASAFVSAGWQQELLLLLAGPLTAVPLLLFAAGARRIPLSLVGLLQYISPTLQLLLGVLVWREPFNRTKFLGYALIWLSLAIYSAERLWSSRAGRRADLPV
jgi:chloramphenicol-sensitive protein RarD